MANDLATHLVTAGYEGVFFPVVDIITDWGHDSTKHQSRGTPGADIETTGLQPRSVSIRAALINGIRGWPDNLFPDRYRELIAKLHDVPQGKLLHPSYGQINVQFDKIHEEFQPNVQNGLYLQLSFTERGDPIQLFASTSQGKIVGTADSVVGLASSADALGAPFGAPPIFLVIESTIDFLEFSDRNFLQVNSAIASAVSEIASRLLFILTLPITVQPYRLALEELRSTLFAYRAEYLGQQQPVTITVPQDMSLARVAALPLVYGDSSKAGLLLQANRIPDPSLILAGTELVVLPIPQ